jgi:hypothetical protein
MGSAAKIYTENGVEVFVRVDDAAYSGMQSGEELLWLIENIDTISTIFSYHLSNPHCLWIHLCK